MTASSKPQTPLQTYVKFVSAVFGSDKVLKVVAYGLGLSGNLLNRGGADSKLATALCRLGGDISNARVVNRLHGTLESIEAYVNNSWAGNWSDPTVRQLAKLQALSMIFYAPLEALCWVRCIAPHYFTGDWEKAMNYSCVAWVAYILLDVWAGLKKIQELHRRSRRLIKDKVAHTSRNDDDNEDSGDHNEVEVELHRRQELAQIEAQRVDLMWGLVRNCLFFPNSVHWSVRGGVLSPIVSNTLGLSEGIVGLWRAWPSS